MKERGNTTTNTTSNLSNSCSFSRSFSEIIVQVSALSIVGLLSLVGNILIIYVVLRNKQLRRGNNLFFMNMAISDLFVPLMMLPREIVENYTQERIWPFTGTWGDITCKIFMFLQNISASVSILTLICMTIDRYCAIVFPTKISLISDKSRYAMIVSTWIISSATSSTYLVTMRAGEKRENNVCFHKWPKGSIENSSHIEMTFNLVFYFIIPLGLLIILYGIILTKLKAKTLVHSSEMARKRMQVARRVTIMTVVIVGLFGFFWGPIFIFRTVLAFHWHWKLPRYCFWSSILFAMKFLAFAHAAVNPFVCFVFATKYRKGLKETFTTRQGADSNNLELKSAARFEKVLSSPMKTILTVTTTY